MTGSKSFDVLLDNTSALLNNCFEKDENCNPMLDWNNEMNLME